MSAQTTGPSITTPGDIQNVTREVKCIDQNGNLAMINGVYTPSLCDPTLEPASTRPETCNQMTYTWHLGEWGTCVYSTSCESIESNPTSTQTSSCNDLSTTQCGAPTNIISCIIMPTDRGIQSRDNICKDQNGLLTPNSLCLQPEPPTKKACNLNASISCDVDTYTRTSTVLPTTLCPAPSRLIGNVLS
jgi:hypothetical protein